MSKPSLYIAGPMTGLPDSNYPAFFKAEKALRRAGFDRILNPARTIVPNGSSWNAYMRAALAMVVQCDGVALLPNWEDSRGAVFERDVAIRLDMDYRSLAVWLS